MMELNTLHTWLEMARNRLMRHSCQVGEINAVQPTSED